MYKYRERRKDPESEVPSLYLPRLSGVALSRGLPTGAAKPSESCWLPRILAQSPCPREDPNPRPWVSFPSTESPLGSVCQGNGAAGPGWPGKCPGLREARPSSERTAIPSLWGSQLESWGELGSWRPLPWSSTPTWQSLGWLEGSLLRELHFWDGSR